MEDRCKHELVTEQCADCQPRPTGSARPDGVNGRIPPVQARTDATRARNAGPRDDAGNAAELVAGFLPAGFLNAYEQVLMAAYGARNLGSGRPPDDTTLVGVGRGSGGLGSVKSETPDVRNGATPSRKIGSSVPIRSERALHYRAKIDRKIRQVGRDIADFLASLDNPQAVRTSQRRCTGRCGKFGDGDWNYCARCGAPMRQAD